jgi:hypothetical protein
MKAIFLELDLTKMDSNLKSDDIEKYKLSILMPSIVGGLMNITIFDAYDKIAAKGIGSSEYELSKGLYTIRTEVSGQIEDKYIRLDKDISHTINPPKIYSSAPLTNNLYNNTHEYYTDKAIHFSRKENETFTFKERESSSQLGSLMIFLRYPEQNYGNSRHILTENKFVLYDKFGKTICTLSNKTSNIDIKYGFLAFNSNLPVGLYYLGYYGKEDPREMPIYIYPDWQTQFFMMLSDNRPLWGSIRIFLSNSFQYDPSGQQNIWVDILLDKLQNADYQLSNELIDQIADDKFQYPLPAILCAYIYLKSDKNDCNDLFERILDKLKTNILYDKNSPDIKALQLLLNNHNFEPNSSNKPKVVVKSIDAPPMIRLGFESINQKAIQTKGFIACNSILDFISENRFLDSSWTTFSPVIKKWSEKNSISQNTEEILEGFYYPQSQYRKATIKGLSDNSFDNIKPSNKLKHDFSSIKKNLKKETNLKGWVGNSVKETLEIEPKISLQKIAEKLNITQNTILRSLNEELE